MNSQSENYNTYAQAAQVGSPSVVENVNDLASRIGGIFNIAIYLLVTLAVVFIVWNVVMYMVKGNEPDAKKEAAKSVSWGILGLAIIISMWGLVNILVGSFRTSTGKLPNLPNADFVNTNFTNTKEQRSSGYKASSGGVTPGPGVNFGM
ncbi:MAG: pilin [Candidatus Paceibacterota bacterium]